MIISHERRFIFVKTVKTAGTSLEIALSKFCGPEDVITPISAEDEAARQARGFRGPQSYARPLREWSLGDLLRAPRKKPVRFFNHMTAADIRRLVGEDVWRAYHKVTVVRNPWDRAISYYYFINGQEPPRKQLGLSAFLDANREPIRSHWDRYAQGDELIVDQVIRFEDFPAGLSELGARIGVGEELNAVFGSIRAKAGIRPNGAGRQSLSPADIDLIGRLARREVERFGYTPPPAPG